MAATLWQRMRGSSATRLFSAYLAFVLTVAMVGPGLSVYASEGELLAEEPVVLPAEVVPGPASDEPVELVSDPVSEALPVEPPAEAEESSESPATVSAESVVPVEPVVALAAPVVVLGTPVPSPDDNPPLTSGGVKIEDPSSGTYTLATVDEAKPPYPADFSITLTTYQTSAGWFVDFVSNYPISLVVVKGGDGANLYSYDPAVLSDTGLHAPANASGKFAGLSHIDFYFGTIDEPEPGDILVHKFLDENGNGEYEPLLGESLLEGWEFSLSDGESELDSGMTGEDGMLLFADLEAGTYSVTETLIEGWDNTTPLTQEAEVVSGETTHLFFGNMEESLPFTELDLAITKLADKHVANPGDLITYTLTYRNLGDLPAEDYTIVDDFDERYVSIVNANGGVVSGGKITWTFAGPLTKEAGPQTLTYTVRVISGMPLGTTRIDNVVVIDHPLDENPANDRDDERVVVTVSEPFLPFTGGEYLLLLAAALITGAAGLVLRVKPQAS